MPHTEQVPYDEKKYDHSIRKAEDMPDGTPSEFRKDEESSRLDADKARAISDVIHVENGGDWPEKEVADAQKRARELAYFPEITEYAVRTEREKADRKQSRLYDSLEELYDSNPQKFAHISGEEFMAIAREYSYLIERLEDLESAKGRYDEIVRLIDKKIENRDTSLLINNKEVSYDYDFEPYVEEFNKRYGEPDFFEMTPRQYYDYYKRLCAFIVSQKITPEIEKALAAKQEFLDSQKV